MPTAIHPSPQTAISSDHSASVSQTAHLTRPDRRVAFAMLAALLLASIAALAIGRSTGYWQIAAFGFAPDLALFYGAGRGLAQGQIRPRAVGAYNAVHRFWGPIALATLGVLSVGFFIGALTWGFHIALDRALGYGLRTNDGYQHP